MLNTITDLAEQYTYKFDDIFEMEYSLYFMLVEKNAILNDVRKSLSESN